MLYRFKCSGVWRQIGWVRERLLDPEDEGTTKYHSDYTTSDTCNEHRCDNLCSCSLECFTLCPSHPRVQQSLPFNGTTSIYVSSHYHVLICVILRCHKRNIRRLSSFSFSVGDVAMETQGLSPRVWTSGSLGRGEKR